MCFTAVKLVILPNPAYSIPSSKHLYENDSKRRGLFQDIFVLKLGNGKGRNKGPV
jgi:hypothetical protein